MSQLGVSRVILHLCLMLVAFPIFCITASARSDIMPQSDLAVTSPPQAAVITPSNKTIPENKPGLIDQENYLIPGASVYASSFGYHEAQRLAKECVFINTDSYDNFIDLQNGNILLSPQKDVVVGIGTSKIDIKSGATVFIMKSENDVVIYDLHQTKPKQVSVLMKKHKLAMEPGRMIVLTQQNTDDFEKLDINCHSVMYRNAKSLDSRSNTERAFVADFALTSALITIEPLRRLVVSNNRQDRLALQKLVKDAVLLQEFAFKQGSNL